MTPDANASTDVDTAALRARADRHIALGSPYAAMSVPLPPDTVRALCDGYDEAARLRERMPCDGDCEFEGHPVEWCSLHGRTPSEIWAYGDSIVAERDAARQALADLAADLRALCDEADTREANWWEDIPDRSLKPARVRAVIDRHAPATPTTEEDR